MPSVQFFERGPTKGALQAQLLSQVAQPLGAMGGQQFRKGQLADAFKKLESAPQNYLSQLSAIAPELMTIPGGAQLLGELAPLLQKGAVNATQAQAIQSRLNQLQGGQAGGQPQEPQNIDQMLQQVRQEKEPTVPRGKEPALRKRETPESIEPLKPQRTVGPTIQRPMTPNEKEQYALNLMNQSRELGNPIPYEQAIGMADKQNQSIIDFNNQIQSEQERKEQFLKDMSTDVVSKALGSGLISDNPTDQAVAEKLGYEGSRAETPEQRWNYVKKGLQDYSVAKSQIERNGTFPGPFGTIAQKIMGTYRDKEQIKEGLQPALDFFRKNDLIPEARQLIGDSLGFGPEDIESTIFPFTGNEKKQLNAFSPNSIKPKLKGSQATFPGDSYQLPENKFNEFQENLANFLEKNPDVNLISLRGFLNQDRRYSWRDISKAMNKLIEDQRFIPDHIQRQQLPYIEQHPTPGLASQFNEFIKGTK